MSKRVGAGNKGSGVGGLVNVNTIKLNSIHLNDGSHGLPKNPRLIKDDRFKQLCESIERDPQFMAARPIVIDEAGVILGGNMRYRACRELGMKELPADWVQTVEGWSVEQKRRFILLDNNTYGEYDFDILANEFDIEELIGSGVDDDTIKSIVGDDDSDNPYTRKIEAPIYEITGDKPEVSELYITDKHDELVREIEGADVPEEIKRFLLMAATRHIEFHYGNIAEFYAHSDKAVQELFEDSLLVIIDFDKAIEKGFVKLADDVIALYQEATNAED